MNYVFYKGKLHDQYEPRSQPMGKELPEHSWVFNNEQGYWYYVESTSLGMYMPNDQVPAEYRTHMLLIN